MILSLDGEGPSQSPPLSDGRKWVPVPLASKLLSGKYEAK